LHLQVSLANPNAPQFVAQGSLTTATDWMTQQLANNLIASSTNVAFEAASITNGQVGTVTFPYK